MATQPDIDVRDHLASNVAGLTADSTVFNGPKRAPDRNSGIPEEAVFCLATGGPPPSAFITGGGVERRFTRVQITIRSNPHDFNGGQTLARNVRDAVHHSVPSGYLEAEVQETEPNYLGAEEHANHLWTINVILEHRQ